MYTGRQAHERQLQTEVQVENTVVLSVGDGYHLRIGKDRIVYAGMVSDKVFSIAVRRWPFIYQGYAWNLFFPKGQRSIRIDGVNLVVESVTPEQIEFRA